jgi:hypothetical protein
MYEALKRKCKETFLNHNVTEEIEKRNNSSIFSKTGRIYSDSRISYIERESEIWIFDPRVSTY